MCKNHWHWIGCIILLQSISPLIFGQDSTAVAKPSAKDFGLMFGGSMVRLEVASTPYFYAPTQQLITVEGGQHMGLTIGMFYNFALTHKWMLRQSVEAHMANNSVTYYTGTEYNEHYSVVPVALEFPLTLVYGINQRAGIESRGWKGMGVFVAARPVLPLALFNSNFPVTKSFSMNVDLGISSPKALRKTVMRSELFISGNVMNWVGQGGASDYRTNMIQDIRRHFAGIRFFFN